MAILVGFLFGIFLIKSEAISWFRIQEMFLFESFHLYGVIGSAIVSGFISIRFIKYFQLKSFKNEEILILPKANTNKASFNGGILFGLGWALTGICPGTLFANAAFQIIPVSILFIFCLIGAFTYERFKQKLPH